MGLNRDALLPIIDKVIPLTLTDSQDLPSLESIFGSNSLVLRSLDRASIKTVVPVMLLPQEELISQVRGIGKTGATYITGALTQVGLQHHRFSDHLASFIDQAFGSVGKAPIGVLHVISIVSEHCTRSHYAPLKLIHNLEKRYPRMAIEDLAGLTPDQLTEAIHGHSPFGPVQSATKREVKEVNQRLRNLDYDQLICMDEPTTRSSRLSLVR